MQSLHCLGPIAGSKNTDNAALGQLDHKVRAQLRAISGLQRASRKMGLGATAFDDGARRCEVFKLMCLMVATADCLLSLVTAQEFIAMLREQLAYQREQLKEAQNYAETHPKGTSSARYHLKSQAGIGEDWRHGMEILPFHAAQKRLAFAKLFYTATRSTIGVRLDQHGVPRALVDVDADVVARVGYVFPVFVCSSHIHMIHL